eukprot:GGOE01044251.1.p1 GENE.GGOE01044251.1~~GGOE01044251.1.p1  ORF type:complete len:757 (-),score=129.14 GGOE01044251.1:341-2611(-)
MVTALHRPKRKGSSSCRVNTFLSHRAIGLHPARDQLFDGILGQRGLPHCRTLSGHGGCVNSISFSHHDGRLLVSGSDDRRVLLWRCFDSQAKGQPAGEYVGHLANVFCTVWADNNRCILSCGNEGKILRHDVEQPAPIGEYVHEDSVHKVSVHPEDANVFVSASHDFTLKLWDVRTGVAPQGTIIGLDAFNAVAFSPCDSHLFLSCDGSAVCMWDLRKSFGPDRGPSLEAARQFKQCVLRQYMAVCRHHSGLIFLPEISGVAFNRLGTHFICSAWKAVPLLYSVESSTPLMAFHAEGYSNKVTHKSASFAGSNDELVISGSDDWGIYIWDTGMAKHQADNNHHRLHSSLPRSCTAAQKWHLYECSQPKSLRRVQTNAELVVESPAHVLRGHQSIVNSVDWNVAEPMVASAGVEKHIRLWSPWAMQGQVDSPEPIRVPKRDFSTSRVGALREMVGRDADEAEGMSSEASTLELFDYYTLRMESDSEGDSASHGQRAPVDGISETDWDTWQTERSSATRQAGEDQTETERVFSSSDSDNDLGGYDTLGSEPNSPLLPRRQPRPFLSMAYDTAALLQQLSEPLPSDGECSEPGQEASSQGPFNEALPARSKGRDPRSGCWSPPSKGSLDDADPVNQGCGAQGYPSVVLQCLDQITATALLHASGMIPAEDVDDPDSIHPTLALDTHLCRGPGSGPTEPERTPPSHLDGDNNGDNNDANNDDDDDGEVNSGPEEDPHGRKRPRSTAGSPDSTSRPSKRCE